MTSSLSLRHVACHYDM